MRRELDPVAPGGLSWRRLFEKLSEGFVVGELVRDASGDAVDWMYLDVNAAWSDLVGMASDDVVGRTVREVLPDADDTWIADMARVVATGRPQVFTRTVGATGRSFEGHAFHLEDDRFAVVFVETTDRQRKEARQAALLSLGDHIRDLDDVEAIAATGTRLVGEALGASRVAFGRIDPDLGTLALGEGWHADGAAGIPGIYRFAEYGRLLDEMLRGEPLVIRDVRSDPRTAADPAPLLALGIGALVNIPVRERGRTVAALIVHSATPRAWTGEEIGFLRDVADRVDVGIARLRAEQRQTVLNDELSHRMKNTLAMVQAIAMQTLRKSTEEAALDDFERRLGALAAAHDVLLGRDRDAAELGAVARRVLAVVAADRVDFEGPATMLGGRAAVSLSLLLHELGTNAAKYGALSVEGGRVALDWSVAGEDLTLHWRERGGPPAQAPTRTGFGTRLIRAGLTGSGAVEMRYEPAGFAAEMRAPLRELLSA